jgi:hypothetical protein
VQGAAYVRGYGEPRLNERDETVTVASSPEGTAAAVVAGSKRSSDSAADNGAVTGG